MSNDSKLIASGSYGCVVLPPITSNISEIKKRYTNKEKDDIGKVFKFGINGRKEAITEFKRYKDSVENILNYNKIVPKIKGYYIISKIDNISINKCINIFSHYLKEDIHQLIYENAGITFSDYPYNKLNYKKLLKMLKVFFKSFNNYTKYGKIHSDINSGNIMIKDNKILLIDFGLEKNKDNIFDRSKNSKFYKYKYIFYSPEFRLLYLKEKVNNKININFGFNNLKNLFNSNYDIMSKEYILQELSNLLDNFNVDYKKLDVYSIGVNLYLIRDKIIFSNQKEIEEFDYLIKKMIEPNPINRFSISEIIKYAS